MIVIAGIMEFEPCVFEQAKSAARTLVDESRKEAGCSLYLFSEDINAVNTLCFYEEWAGPEALDAHRKAPHTLKFKEALEELAMLSRVVKRYKIDSSNVLS